MPYHQLLVVALLATSITTIQAAPTRVTCLVEDYSDGNPKSFRLIFDESDKSWIVVNGSRYPYEDNFGKSEIQAYEDVKIEWCDTLSRGSGNEPARICYAVNRMTGDFLVSHQRTGKSKAGKCTVGRVPEGRKF